MRFGMWFPWAVLLVIVTVGVMVWRHIVIVSDLETRWQQAHTAQVQETQEGNEIIVSQRNDLRTAEADIDTARDAFDAANLVIAEQNDSISGQNRIIAHQDEVIASQRDTINLLSTPEPTYTPQPTYTLQPTHTPYPTATPRATHTPRPTYTRYPTPTPTIWYRPTPTPSAAERVSVYEGIKVYSDDGAGRGFLSCHKRRAYLITAAHVLGSSRWLYIEHPTGDNIRWEWVTYKRTRQDVAIVDVTRYFDCYADGYIVDDTIGHILSKGEITSYESSYTSYGDCPLVGTDVVITNAPFYPGYSGSPVVNDWGDLVGMNVCFSEDSSYVVPWEVIYDLLP